MGKFTFEDKADVIDRLLSTRRKKWSLNGAGDIDYEDVCQIIRQHIFLKWDKFDQTKPLEQWVNKIISNQIINLLEEHYLKFSKPCVNCALNQGGNLCGLTKTGEKSSECPLYKKWAKNKQAGFNIKNAESIHDDNSLSSLVTPVRKEIDWEVVTPKFHLMMKQELPSKIYEVYKLLYMDFVSDSDLAQKMGFKTSEKGKTPGYKQIYNFKKRILETAKKVAKECVSDE